MADPPGPRTVSFDVEPISEDEQSYGDESPSSDNTVKTRRPSPRAPQLTREASKACESRIWEYCNGSCSSCAVCADCDECDECDAVRARNICGFQPVVALRLLKTIAMPTIDAVLDWSVVLHWHRTDDVNWFANGVSINVVSGALSGLVLASILHGLPRFAECCSHRVLMFLCIPCGVIGMAPVLLGIIVLSTGETRLLRDGAQFLALAELVFETFQQSVLQTYVGVAFGKFSPYSEDFSITLPLSVVCSLLNAGITTFGFEMVGRNNGPQLCRRCASTRTDGKAVSTCSCYGLITLLLRSMQFAAIIFTISLLACTQKEYAVFAIFLSVVVFVSMALEPIVRDETNQQGASLIKSFFNWTVFLRYIQTSGVVYCFSLVLSKQAGRDNLVPFLVGMLLLLSFLATGIAVEVADIVPHVNARSDRLGRTVTRRTQARVQFLRLGAPTDTIIASGLWGIFHLLLVLGMAFSFTHLEPMTNNYADSRVPPGHPGEPQYFDCRDRHAGIYIAAASTMLSFALLPISTFSDPQNGACAQQLLDEHDTGRSKRRRAGYHSPKGRWPSSGV
eukprot:COSAG02_NODE_2000_length_10140_cov_14.090429_9_plen_564_part_00